MFVHFCIELPANLAANGAPNGEKALPGCASGWVGVRGWMVGRFRAQIGRVWAPKIAIFRGQNFGASCLPLGAPGRAVLDSLILSSGRAL